jgi:CheY-like chemotaxis protein
LLEALRRTDGAAARLSGPIEVPAEARQGPCVLVVDDDEISRSVTSQLLARLGCTVQLAKSGALAIERIRTDHFDLVFMDCQMPEMDGFTTTEKIIAMAGRKAPPIVALTANIGVQDRERCFAVGMRDFVSKPVRKAELARVVKTWIPE